MIAREEYLEKIKSAMWDGNIKVITGLRRSGKSTLLFELFFEFLISTGVKEKNIIKLELDKRKWYPECFYLLAMVDYLSNENNIALCNEYDDLRKYKLEEILYPSDVLLMDKLMKTDENRKQSVKEGIPEFMNFNIVESDIRNVI